MGLPAYEEAIAKNIAGLDDNPEIRKTGEEAVLRDVPPHLHQAIRERADHLRKNRQANENSMTAAQQRANRPRAGYSPASRF